MDFLVEVVTKIAQGSGFAALDIKTIIMLGIACVLLYMGIGKGFEPLLLVPIAFGMLLANLPITGLFAEPVYDAATHSGTVGFMWVLYQGVQYAIYPSIIFMGIGAMTDFGPLLANPMSLMLGAAAQLGIFAAFLMALVLGFEPAEAAAIGVIGGADGPTAILTASKLAVRLLPAIAIAAYSYMALVPIIQPFAIKLVTTKKDRAMRMPYRAQGVSKRLRILFPIVVTAIAGLVAPSSVALVGFLMFGNLIRECGVLTSLSQTAQNELANLITLLLGITISFSMRAEQFVQWQTLMIMGLGLVAFVLDSVVGVLFVKVLNLITPKNKINPMVGAAGISAFPMSSRVIEKLGQEADSQNHLLMHAVAANVSGQIASVVAGGVVLQYFANNPIL